MTADGPEGQEPTRDAGSTPIPVGAPGRRNAPEPQPGDDDHVVTVFAAVGGQPFFDHLVERFYAHVATDDVLLRLYPEKVDLGPAAERLALFLGQYWGGPTTYSDRRGHPRLRMRHAPFTIGAEERDHWLAAMLEALEATLPESPLDDELRGQVRGQMTAYFEMAADAMVNAPD